jgi:hypothetical protein
MAIPYTEVIAGPMIADADFYLFRVNDQADLVQRNPVNFLIDGQASPLRIYRGDKRQSHSFYICPKQKGKKRFILCA